MSEINNQCVLAVFHRSTTRLEFYASRRLSVNMVEIAHGVNPYDWMARQTDQWSELFYPSMLQYRTWVLPFCTRAKDDMAKHEQAKIDLAALLALQKFGSERREIDAFS